MAFRSLICILALSKMAMIQVAAIDSSYLRSRSTQAPAAGNTQETAKDAQEIKFACPNQTTDTKDKMDCMQVRKKMMKAKDSEKMKGDNDTKDKKDKGEKDKDVKDAKDCNEKGNDQKGNDQRDSGMRGDMSMGASNDAQGMGEGQQDGSGGQNGQVDGNSGMGMAQKGGATADMAALKQPKAIYFMTNAADNSIVALPVMENGNVMDGSITPTGGKGQSSVDAMTNKPNAVDGAASQGAVRVAGQASLSA